MSTTNYDQFVFVEGNRAINRGKVEHLKEEIKRHNLLPNYPIMCRRKNNRHQDTSHRKI